MPNPMTPEQNLAATLLHQPMSVMASAGSGKTTTMVERYLNLLKAGVSPRRILTVTFTKEAAEQLRERITERLIEEQLSSKWNDEVVNSTSIGTLHSLCYSILNQYGSDLGFLPVSQIIDDFSFSSAFLKHYNDWLAQISPDSLNKLLDHFSHRELKEMTQMIYRNRFLFYDSLQLAQDAGAKDIGASVILMLGNELKGFNTSLANFFHTKGHYSFDELEHLALRILKESALARTRLSEEFQHILVDEFQDTSPIQWQILTLLLGDNLNKLFIVGDPKQSIYGFRKAEPALFTEVTQLMSLREGKQLELIHNFRTQRTLLMELNSISATLFSEQSLKWTPMVPGLSQDGALPSSLSVHLFGPKEKTPRQSLYLAEVEAVCAYLERLLSQGIAPGTVALLFRNSDRITEFSAAFSMRGWTHRCQKTDNLSKQLSTLEIIAFLQFLLDPTQDGHLIHFLRSVYIHWSYEQILLFVQKRQRDTSGRFEPMVNLLRREPPEELTWLVRLLDSGETRVEKCLERLFLETRSFPQNMDAFEALLKPLSSPELSLFDISHLLDSFQDSDYLFQQPISSNHSDSGIQLMTVHASKGLEFEHVILVDSFRQLPSESPPLLLKAGLPPGIRYWEQEKRVVSSSYQCLLEDRRQKDEEESKRILYVALTRAKQTLTLFLPHETAINYPKNSWADLLIKAGVGERACGNTPELTLSPSQIEVTTTRN